MSALRFFLKKVFTKYFFLVLSCALLLFSGHFFYQKYRVTSDIRALPAFYKQALPKKFYRLTRDQQRAVATKIRRGVFFGNLKAPLSLAEIEGHNDISGWAFPDKDRKGNRLNTYTILNANNGALKTRDVSIEPVLPMNRRHKVWLISYADGDDNFQKNVWFQFQTALNRGVDAFISYGRRDLDDDFCAKNKAILSHKRGAGFWVWKPYVILKTLKQVPENDVVIYMDAGFSVQKDLSPLLTTLQDKTLDFLFFTTGVKLRTGTKREAYVTMGLDDRCLDFPVMQAGLMFIKNNQKSRAFIEKWLHYCQNPVLILDGSLTDIKPFPDRNSHWNDQSILNLTLYQDTLKPSKEQLSFWVHEEGSKKALAFHQYVYWHHRHTVHPWETHKVGKSLYNFCPNP